MMGPNRSLREVERRVIVLEVTAAPFSPEETSMRKYEQVHTPPFPNMYTYRLRCLAMFRVSPYVCFSLRKGINRMVSS